MFSHELQLTYCLCIGFQSSFDQDILYLNGNFKEVQLIEFLIQLINILTNDNSIIQGIQELHVKILRSLICLTVYSVQNCGYHLLQSIFIAIIFFCRLFI